MHGLRSRRVQEGVSAQLALLDDVREQELYARLL